MSPPPSYRTEKTIIAKPLDSKLTNNKKQKVLTWIHTLLKQIESYTDNILNTAEVNVIDPTKDNFTPLLSVKEILDKFEISKGDCYIALSISKDEDLELHLKRKPHSCFENLAVIHGHTI